MTLALVSEGLGGSSPRPGRSAPSPGCGSCGQPQARPRAGATSSCVPVRQRCSRR